MSFPIIDCPEVVGKTVSSLKLYATDCDSVEIRIDFTDGTSFSSAYESPRGSQSGTDSDRCRGTRSAQDLYRLSVVIPPRNSGHTRSYWTLPDD